MAASLVVGCHSSVAAKGLGMQTCMELVHLSAVTREQNSSIV